MVEKKKYVNCYNFTENQIHHTYPENANIRMYVASRHLYSNNGARLDISGAIFILLFGHFIITTFSPP